VFTALSLSGVEGVKLIINNNKKEAAGTPNSTPAIKASGVLYLISSGSCFSGYTFTESCELAS